MSAESKTDAGRDQVPAVVFACLYPGEFQIILWPGVGLLDGGVPRDVPTSVLPFKLRVPNTPLWVQLDGQQQIVRIWRREDDAVACASVDGAANKSRARRTQRTNFTLAIVGLGLVALVSALLWLNLRFL